MRALLSLTVLFIAGQAVAQTAPATPAAVPPQPATTVVPSPAPASVEGGEPATIGQLPAVPPAGAAADATLPPADEPNAAAPLFSVPEEGGGSFSFGTATNSILFTPLQINNMKKALQAFESATTATTSEPTEEEVEFTVDKVIKKETIEEPKTYPSYHLSSVVYRGAADWSVWVNNIRITPTTNEGEVVVTQVQPDRVWFRWDPDYMRAVVTRIEHSDWAAHEKMQHRLVENTIVYDKEKGEITFSLKPNQTFAAGYFQVFEGRIAPPLMPEVNIDDVLDGENEIAPDAAAGQGAPTGEGAAAEQGPAAPAAANAAAPPVNENAAGIAPSAINAINSLLGPRAASPAPAKP